MSFGLAWVVTDTESVEVSKGTRVTWRGKNQKSSQKGEGTGKAGEAGGHLNAGSGVGHWKTYCGLDCVSLKDMLKS